MNVTLTRFSSLSSTTLGRARFTAKVREPAGPPSVKTTISDSAQKLSDEASSIDSSSGSEKVASLKRYIKNIDFTSASPSDITNMAGVLYKAGELSADQLAQFVSMEQDTEKPISASAKINVTDHFNMMLDSISSAASSDPSLSHGVNLRKASIETLKAIQSFASSDRQHILTEG